MLYVKKITLIIVSFTLFTAFALLYYFGVLGAHFFLLQTSYGKLPGWKQDNQKEALYAFKQSCAAIMLLDPKKPFSAFPSSGKVRDWQTICQASNNLVKEDNDAARQFFEYWFQPYRVENNFNPNGLFTGYYVPLIHASLKKDARFSTPIYALPNDLIKIQLNCFYPDLAGKTVTGKLENNQLMPYPDRTAINAGAIENKARVLAWSDNPVDVFFAQIQGSALVQLPNQQKFLIGYAGDNGRFYTSIGKALVAKHAIAKQAISMQAIRNWLNQHPENVNDTLNQNASYVFFQILKQDKPIGTQHVPLTPQRSLAVDTHFIPLGAPIWLNTTFPQTALKNHVSFQKLLIAQDTGGAIKGIVRGDVFWGQGEEAAFSAGYMQNRGQYWVLLPRYIK